MDISKGTPNEPSAEHAGKIFGKGVDPPDGKAFLWLVSLFNKLPGDKIQLDIEKPPCV